MYQYVSRVYSAPNRTAYDFKSNAFGLAVEKVSVDNAERGWWYASVYGWGAQNATYNVLAHDASEGHPIELDAGLPQGGYAGRGEFTYYEIFPPQDGEKITISVTAVSV